MSTTQLHNGITGSANTHARLSPSDSKRWTNCTASIAYQEANSHRVPKKDGSVWSDTGTEAHEWAAKLLLRQNSDGMPEEFVDPVTAYVEHCWSIADKGYHTEVVVPLYYQPEQTGTCDFAHVTDQRVVVRDLKFGAGVLVTSDENTQLAIYAYSLITMMSDLYDFTDDTVIDIAVFQPRHREGADQPAWITTLKDLRKFCEDIEYRAIQARTGADRVKAKLPCGERDISPEEILEAAPMVVFHPEEGDGGSCRWCSCKAFCPKRAAAIATDLPESVPLIDLLAVMPDLTKEEKKLDVAERVDVVAGHLGMDRPLTDDLLVKLFARMKAVNSWLSDIKEYLEERAIEGNPAPGTHLTLGREGNREWANEDAADTFLTGQGIKADDRYTKKLISPTQAEKLLPKGISTRAKTRFSELVTRSAARKVLALADDERQPVEADISAMPNLETPDFEV